MNADYLSLSHSNMSIINAFFISYICMTVAINQATAWLFPFSASFWQMVLIFVLKSSLRSMEFFFSAVQWGACATHPTRGRITPYEDRLPRNLSHF